MTETMSKAQAELSDDEFSGIPVTGRLKALDADGDGMVSRVEIDMNNHLREQRAFRCALASRAAAIRVSFWLLVPYVSLGLWS